MDLPEQDLEPAPAGRGAPERARRRRRRHAAAVGGSALLHAALAASALWSFTASSFEGGAGSAGGDGSAVTVTLVGPIGGSLGSGQPAAAQRTEAELSTLLGKFRQVPSPIPAADRAAPRGDAAQLFKEISQSRGKTSPDDNSRAQQDKAAGSGENGAADQSAQAKGKDSRAKAVEGHAEERGDQGHMTGDMWSQIETCWRPVAAVPITLEVVIDSYGRLAVPPRILRPQNAAIDERRLHAEAVAVQAVAGCAPFRSGAPVFGRKTYRFAFNPPG